MAYANKRVPLICREYIDDMFAYRTFLICIPISVDNPYNKEDRFYYRTYVKYSFLLHPYDPIDVVKDSIGTVNIFTDIHQNPFIATFLIHDGKNSIETTRENMQLCLTTLYNRFVNKDFVLSNIYTIVFPIQIGSNDLKLWIQEILPLLVTFTNKMECIPRVRVCIAAHETVYNFLKDMQGNLDKTIFDGKISKCLHFITSLEQLKTFE